MKKIPSYHIKQKFLSGKLSPRAVAATMHTFKELYDYDVLLENLPEILNIDKRIPDLIWGELYPKSLNELGASNHYYFRAVGEAQEVNWVLIQVAKNKKQLAKFVEIRDRVYRNVLLGKYDEAELELNDLKKSFGVSVWYFEMKILIYSLSDRESKIFEILEAVNTAAKESKKIGKTAFVPYLLHFIYLRTSEYTTANFENELNGLSKRSRDSFQVDRLNYYKHRLNYYATIDQVELRSPLVYEAPNSLIDRYGTLLTVIKSLFIKAEIDRNAISAVAMKLYRITGDKQLLPIVAYANSSPKAYYNNPFLSILNDYYAQKYDDVIIKSKELVKEDPNNFDNLRVYVQAMILQNKSYAPIYPGHDAIINDVTKGLYDVLTEQDNHSTLLWLKTFNKRLYGLPISGALHSFVNEQSGEDITSLMLFTSNTFFDPGYCNIWDLLGEDDNHTKALDYLKKGQDAGDGGITVDYYKSRYSEEPAPQRVASYRKERDRAVSEFALGEYNTCLEACQTLLTTYPMSLPICQIATEYIFKCHEKMGHKMDAITFYVNQFVSKQSLTNKVRLTDFVKGLRNDKYKKLKNNIDLQIFVLLNAEEDEQRALVLERYMDYKEIDDAKGLIEEMKLHKDQKRVELFLTLLIESDVMRHLSYIESTSQMLDEQQVIAQYLTSLESVHHDYYVDFNKQLLEQTLIYSNIEKLDESRIYVNGEALVKYDLDSYENLYVQLSEINKTIKLASSIMFLNVGKVTFLDVSSPNIIGENIQTTKNASMDLASQLFDAICHQYLFSKFGLKTYLSTRIRHGVLEGEIRSVFDSHNLVLLTEGTKYRHIDYWRKSFGLNNEEQSALMGILANFSKELLITIETFKDEVVQIKANEEGKGMINYVITDEEKTSYVYTALQHSTNFQDFCWAMFDLLNSLTELSLRNIRAYIKEELGNKFNEIIGSLETALQIFSTKHFYSDLQQAASDSRADLQGKLIKIEKWFRLQSGKFDDFNLAGQLNLVWEVIAKQYPNINYICRFGIDDAKVTIKAEYYLLVSDILTILYNNMYNHGSSQQYDNVVITAKRHDDELLLHFENRTLKPDKDVNEDIKKRLASNRFQQEHGSGLAKVKNIVLNEFGGRDEDLYVRAIDGKCNVDIKLHLNNLVRDYENIIS